MSRKEIKVKISDILYETGNDGNTRALLKFEQDEYLSKIGFQYLSIPVDETVTDIGSLNIVKGDFAELNFSGNNLQSYNIGREYISKVAFKTTPLPKKCNVCGSDLVATKNILRKVKRLSCRNFSKCNAHSRASIYRLFELAGITDLGLVTYYLNDHYQSRIDHLMDVALIYKSSNGDPNTEPRQALWNGKDELWQVEKKLHEYLLKIHAISDRDFWYLGFGVELNHPKQIKSDLEYPKVISDNFHLVEQLKMFLKVFGYDKGSGSIEKTVDQ